MKTKTFDSVEMKRRAAEQIYEILKEMTVEEQVAFWHKKEREWQKEQQLSLNSVKAS
jgi:hypothetical protein